MEMGMHSRIYKSTNYFVDERFVLVIIAAIIGTLLYLLLRSQAKINKCNRCGNKIESDRWKVCPICGNSLKGKKG
jgi:rubrerythrin